MHIKCTKIISPIDGSSMDSHPSIRIGAEYPLLSVSIGPSRGLQLQILTDEGPSFWNGEMFETVSNDIPDGWILQLSEGSLKIGPKEFLRPGFWESYFDDDPAAVQAFKHQLELIK
ncbi:hypothetical protein NSK11_contig00198-0006 [Nocardia seriolae]|uniref:Uncharacterized protein n=1 Tax=Nocardia seriolae TaxID=37332 RepID=A0ABC9Z5E5_9NOCA|nr:hypothetical protein NSERKGN1266_71360 [Nocardia seriolae]BEK93094.1 hypothetical protein NSER024013_10000 [Nocardia seriolae]GAM51042.1 hypothetical protein NS07_v2contig00197-0006 [Nocardia seriolae]GAP32989.1 hypothetical protein NSK11_contig00198-0006 [Nocardia seriolae]GEM27873.1 hypothetical protein NS2_61120 [Nocardia seriolae NBRC 15557]